MKSPWLLLDVSYLAYRAYYALARGSKGGLSHEGVGTSVIFGVMRDVLQLQEIFNTKRIAFCFDYGKPVRSLDCPEYKANRKEGKSEEELEIILEIKNQIKNLRTEYLKEIGYQNVLFQKGYEADDIIAKLVIDNPGKEMIIVSSDQDLFQLLGEHVSIWNPHKQERYTIDSFSKQFGISPTQWIDVKAMAGCSSDNVQGIKGIGEKTAIAFLTGQLKKGKAFEKIVKGNPIWKRNMGIVTLPYPCIKSIRLVKDRITSEGWSKLATRLGMNSLAASIPGAPRRESPGITRATLGLFQNKSERKHNGKRK